MDKNFKETMKLIFGDNLSDTELRMLEVMPKAKEYCNKDDSDYKFLLEMLVSVLKGNQVLIPSMAEIAGIMNIAYVTGIEHQKKQQVMQAFLSAESEEK
jgi:hypothetical protein